MARADLTYNVVSERLTGRLDGVTVHALAGSGGRAGSKASSAVNWHLQGNPLATHVGGKSSGGTHTFGPIPLGFYALCLHESRRNWIRLTPSSANQMFGRAGFAIHGRGQVGSHGCIVVYSFAALVELVALVKRREDRGASQPILEVIAVGSDVDRKFLTA